MGDMVVTLPHKDELTMATYRTLAADRSTVLDPRILEIGVQTGASLVMWRELWPLARLIAGVDLDPSATWPAGTVRIVADQTDPDLPTTLDEMCGPVPFDLIVDDASHLIGPTVATWCRLWPLVAPGGLYVWEDWGSGVFAPDHYGSPAPLLDKMASEVQRGQAESLRLLPGIALLRKR